MAILRVNDIQRLSPKELSTQEIELKKEYVKLKSQIAGGAAPENPGRMREIRRTLARIKTMRGIKKTNE